MPSRPAADRAQPKHSSELSTLVRPSRAQFCQGDSTEYEGTVMEEPVVLVLVLLPLLLVPDILVRVVLLVAMLLEVAPVDESMLLAVVVVVVQPRQMYCHA